MRQTSDYYPFLTKFVERGFTRSEAEERAAHLRARGYTVTVEWEPKKRSFRLVYQKGGPDEAHRASPLD